MIIQNTDAQRLELGPDCRLAQISWSRGRGSMFCTVMEAEKGLPHLLLDFT